MLLVIDIGNTNIVFGVYNGDRLFIHWRMTSERGKTSDEYGIFLNNFLNYQGIKVRDITDVAVSSVVPPLMPPFERMIRCYLKVTPLIVGPGIKTGMPIKLDNPREVGADRIVNAVAAFERHGGPVIVVDFGTATTFDVVSARGEYMGGAIAPGIIISTEALYTKAAKLPRIELTVPASVIGKNTVAAMQAGVLYGFVGQVDGIVNRIRAALGETARVVATGGLASLIASEATTIDEVEPTLTLEGLRLVYLRNKKQT